VIALLIAGIVVIGLFVYSVVGVVAFHKVMARLPDSDCRRSGRHLKRTPRKGMYCGCRVYAVWAGIFWLPLNLGFILAWSAVKVARVPWKLGTKIAVPVLPALPDHDRIAELQAEADTWKPDLSANEPA
jgi:hypothetical protein